MQTHIIFFQQLIILLLICYIIWLKYEHQLRKWWDAWHQKPKKRRHLRPRSPRDCESCGVEHVLGVPYNRSDPPRWQDIKSKRGRPKEYDSSGYACVESTCIYYQITDPSIHALRRDGTRNQCEDTPQWECGFCGSKRTAWFGTPQYGLKTHSSKVSLVLHLHMKGLAIADISEILEIPKSSIQRWLDQAGKHSERLHESLFKQLIARHIQLDELVTKVRNRTKRVWVWTGMDVQSRLLLAWGVDRRSQKAANRLLHLIYRRIKDDMIPAFTSDGLNMYYYAITPHWGSWQVVDGKRKPVWVVAPELLYGQFRKIRVGYKIKDFYTKMICGTRAKFQQVLQSIDLTGKIQTAYVERLNLTLRHIIPALHRRTWAIAYSIHSLRLRVALGAAYYNFCRPHQALPGVGKRYRTPAMAAGITDHRWKVREFVLHPVY